jgi:putative phosphoribosyl transferase
MTSDTTSGADALGVQREVKIPAGTATLDGDLRVPSRAVGLILFAHGSGSSRFSPRNRFVADVMNRAGFGTLLFDLLTERESQERANVFDIPLLADRLIFGMRWTQAQPETRDSKIGLFGASTGAAAALIAAAKLPESVGAVVSRGGRPDLAGRFLAQVEAPTLLIVGGNDREVLDLNRVAASHLRAECEIAIIPGAGHLFEEPGTLEEAARAASLWFVRFLTAGK